MPVIISTRLAQTNFTQAGPMTNLLRFRVLGERLPRRWRLARFLHLLIHANEYKTGNDVYVPGGEVAYFVVVPQEEMEKADREREEAEKKAMEADAKARAEQRAAAIAAAQEQANQSKIIQPGMMIPRGRRGGN